MVNSNTYTNIIGKEITGKEFNNIFKDKTTLLKFTSENENHNGIQYHDGLNTDIYNFDISKGECSSGGLYFTSKENIAEWIKNHEYVRIVTIPDDARICIYETKFKSNKIILEPRIKILDSDLLLDEQVQIDGLLHGLRIESIKNPCVLIQKLIIEKYGITNIHLINELSEQAQLEIVNKNVNAIHYIQNPNEEVQMTAVNKDGFAIQYISNPSEKVQLAAVNQQGCAIGYIQNPSEKVQLAAVNQDYDAIGWILIPSEKVQQAAIKQDCHSIRYIDNPSEAVQFTAVNQDYGTIRWIANPSIELQMSAVKQDGNVIQFIDNPSEAVQMSAVK